MFRDREIYRYTHTHTHTHTHAYTLPSTHRQTHARTHSGLTMTLFSLAVLQQALPALPLSITLGAIFFVISTHALLPFFEPLLACALLV